MSSATATPPALVRAIHSVRTQHAGRHPNPQYGLGHDDALNRVKIALEGLRIYNAEDLARDNELLRRQNQDLEERLGQALARNRRREEKQAQEEGQLLAALDKLSPPAADCVAYTPHERYRLWFLAHDDSVPESSRLKLLRRFMQFWIPPTYQNERPACLQH